MLVLVGEAGREGEGGIATKGSRWRAKKGRMGSETAGGLESEGGRPWTGLDKVAEGHNCEGVQEV